MELRTADSSRVMPHTVFVRCGGPTEAVFLLSKVPWVIYLQHDEYDCDGTLTVRYRMSRGREGDNPPAVSRPVHLNHSNSNLLWIRPLDLPLDFLVFCSVVTVVCLEHRPQAIWWLECRTRRWVEPSWVESKILINLLCKYASIPRCDRYVWLSPMTMRLLFPKLYTALSKVSGPRPRKASLTNFI